MSDLAHTMKMLGARFSTALRKIDYPIHQGKPNPAHGKYHFVGSVPAACCHENGRSKHYATEEEAIAAAFAAGVEKMQKADCSWVFAPKGGV